MRWDERAKTSAMVVLVVSMLIIMRVVVMVVARRSVSAALGIKRRGDFQHLGAELADHVSHYMIAADAQRMRQELRRQMPVAEMPSNAGEMPCIGAADLQKRLGRGNHFNKPAVLEYQRIAVAQFDRNGKIKQEGRAPCSGHRHSAAMAIVVAEYDAIRGRARPGRYRFNCDRAHAS